MNDRKTAHWERWGWSVTCSDCGWSGIDAFDYCPCCGAIMSEGEIWCQPPLNIKLPEIYICKSCGKEIIAPVNYCPYCGEKIERTDQ